MQNLSHHKHILDACNLLRTCGYKLKKSKSFYQDKYNIVGHQVKALADIDINEQIISGFDKLNPNIKYLSEEQVNKIPTQDIVLIPELLIIDPIDGTASFINGYKGYVLQIAYLKYGIPQYAIVYAPEYDDCYVGIKNNGSYLNGEPLRTQLPTKPATFIDNTPEPSIQLQSIMRKYVSSSYVECGSIGLKVCRIASGQADVFYKDVCLRDWDLLPPALILQEAGGIMLNLNHDPITFLSHQNYEHQGVLALAHKDLLESLVKCYTI